MTTGEKIARRRKQLGLTLEAVGNHVGVVKGTVKKWEMGAIQSMRIDKIEKLAEILGTTHTYLMDDRDDVIWTHENIETMPETRALPILGAIACGTPIFADENIEGFAELDRRISADFALRCKGDSMISARIFDGDLVFIKSQADVANGDIAAVIIDDEATLKRVYKYDGRIELRPENPTHPVLNFEGFELEQLRIIGKAVAFLSGVR